MFLVENLNRLEHLFYVIPLIILLYAMPFCSIRNYYFISRMQPQKKKKNPYAKQTK